MRTWLDSWLVTVHDPTSLAPSAVGLEVVVITCAVATFIHALRAHRRGDRLALATWLTILGHAVELHSVQNALPNALGCDIAAAWAATLCEWLHGFEAASGNSYNNFGYEANSNLYPSAFYLGFKLARLSGSDLESACEEADSDVDDLSSVALKAITQDKRDELRAELSDFFGGDGALYWALHSAIWPDLSKPMGEALELELGSSHFDDLARLDAPWRYVTEGWCDGADD